MGCIQRVKHTFYFKTGATFQIEGYLQILSKELWGTSHKIVQSLGKNKEKCPKVEGN